MSITVKEYDYNPATVNEYGFAIPRKYYHPVVVKDEYYIVGRCISGARFYSEPLAEDVVFDTFLAYGGMVDYFGGGVVELYNAKGEMLKSEPFVTFDI